MTFEAGKRIDNCKSLVRIFFWKDIPTGQTFYFLFIKWYVLIHFGKVHYDD